MNKFILLIFFINSVSICFSQENRIVYNPKPDEIDLAVFMNMMGFDYHKFELQSQKPAYVNVYIDEYINDQLIDSFDHISANKEEAPKALYNLIFTKLDTAKFTLKLYTMSKSDTIEQLRFKIGELGLYKKLKVNKEEFEYSWKLTEFNDYNGPLIELEKKIPLLYYATAEEIDMDGNTVEAFCRVSNILKNKHLIENRGKIKHYFEIGLELVEKIE